MQKHFTLKLVLSIYLIAMITSCSLIKNKKSNPQCPNQVSGILVDMSGLDGCGWMIQLENQSKLNPTNLEDFNISLENNKNINFSYSENSDLMNVCMAGTIVDIICITDRK